jgi:type IV pilus assembly protein PilA
MRATLVMARTKNTLGRRRNADAQSPDGGFTLVELMVVVLVIAVLMAVAVPTFMGARTRAQERAAHVRIRIAMEAQNTFAADRDEFTADPALLDDEESSIDWSAATDESMHVVIGDVLPGDSRQVLLYTKSANDVWFGQKTVRSGPDAGLYTCRGTAEADVDELADCSGLDW